MTSLFASKKGVTVQNIFVGVFFLFQFAVMSFFGVLLGTAILDEFSAFSFTTSYMHSVIATFRSVFLIFDKIIVIMMFVFLIGMAITSYKLAARPVFYVVMFIMAAIYGFGGFIFSYIFSQIAYDPSFSTVIGAFPATLLILTNLHWFALALIVVGSIALYAKKEKGQYLTSD